MAVLGSTVPAWSPAYSSSWRCRSTSASTWMGASWLVSRPPTGPQRHHHSPSPGFVYHQRRQAEREQANIVTETKSATHAIHTACASSPPLKPKNKQPKPVRRKIMSQVVISHWCQLRSTDQAPKLPCGYSPAQHPMVHSPWWWVDPLRFLHSSWPQQQFGPHRSMPTHRETLTPGTPRSSRTVPGT